MIKQYDIDNSAWTQISSAGEEGTCWAEQILGSGNIRVYHSTDASMVDQSVIRHGYPVRYANNNFASVQLKADNASDIYYAITDKDDTTAILTVDVV